MSLPLKEQDVLATFLNAERFELAGIVYHFECDSKVEQLEE